MAVSTFGSFKKTERNLGLDRINTPGMPTTDIIAGVTAVGAITGAYSAYQAGQMQKIAFEHEAAMNDLQAKQLEIEATFLVADKTNELANNLALQNVIAAASGRTIGEGSLQSLAQTSISNLEKDKKRIKTTGETRRVAQLMASSSARASGETASQFGLLSGASELIQGGVETARFIR